MRLLSSRLFRLPTRLHRRARRIRLMTILAILVGLTVLTPLYWIYKPPRFLINHFQSKWPDVLWRHPTDSKILALTIDDAPSTHTRDIMAVLARYDVHATFFVIGNQVAGRPSEDLLADMVSAGHELGNHAQYDELSNALSESTLVEQIHSVEDKIAHAYETASARAHEPIDQMPHFFRPGAGWFSSAMRGTMKRLGYRLVLGSIYPHDAQISYWRVNARHILSMLRPGGIIICHDRRSWTVPMLERVVPEVLARGYKIVTVSQLLKAPTNARNE